MQNLLSFDIWLAYSLMKSALMSYKIGFYCGAYISSLERLTCSCAFREYLLFDGVLGWEKLLLLAYLRYQ